MNPNEPTTPRKTEKYHASIFNPIRSGVYVGLDDYEKLETELKREQKLHAAFKQTNAGCQIKLGNARAEREKALARVAELEKWQDGRIQSELEELRKSAKSSEADRKMLDWLEYFLRDNYKSYIDPGEAGLPWELGISGGVCRDPEIKGVGDTLRFALTAAMSATSTEGVISYRRPIPRETAKGEELWRPLGSTRQFKTHPPDRCTGRPCPVHNPSNHHMKDWPQNYRSDRGITERICPHGIGHPDPDDPTKDSVHGCDGCCEPPADPYCVHGNITTEQCPECEKELSSPAPPRETESNTPETDRYKAQMAHAYHSGANCYLDALSFARTLERRAILAENQLEMEQAQHIATQAERDGLEARAVAAEEELAKAKDDAGIPVILAADVRYSGASAFVAYDDHLRARERDAAEIAELKANASVAHDNWQALKAQLTREHDKERERDRERIASLEKVLRTAGYEETPQGWFHGDDQPQAKLDTK